MLDLILATSFDDGAGSPLDEHGPKLIRAL